MAVTLVNLTGKDAVGAKSALEQVASEIEGRGEVIRGIAPILGGTSLLVVSSRAETSSVTQELENLKRLEAANTISLLDFNHAKDALLAKLGK
jgi:hypothetical protein